MQNRAAQPLDQARLRGWLEHVAQTAIDWLDQLDAAAEGLEDDEREIISEDDGAIETGQLAPEQPRLYA